MGQLERLISRREHGLELYAGGKGHGEPPGIDWAHDYVDRGGFQKLRMRNWAACPNFEVEIGPLAVRVPALGVPAQPGPSPVHAEPRSTWTRPIRSMPAGPYFLKEGRMDVIQDVDVEAMRDDEWVFSGYSFTDTLWIDRAGKLHEGPVPAAEADRPLGRRLPPSREPGCVPRTLAGALGRRVRRHRQQRVADPALPGARAALEPLPGAADPAEGGHGPPPEERLPALRLPRGGGGASDRGPAAAPAPSGRDRGGRDPRGEQARATGALARPGEAGDDRVAKAAIWDALREVRDEQLYAADANIVDLGLVYDVRWRLGTVHVLMTMPHRGRPVHDFFVTRGGGRVEDGIRERLLKLDRGPRRRRRPDVGPALDAGPPDRRRP